MCLVLRNCSAVAIEVALDETIDAGTDWREPGIQCLFTSLANPLEHLTPSLTGSVMLWDGRCCWRGNSIYF